MTVHHRPPAPSVLFAAPEAAALTATALEQDFAQQLLVLGDHQVAIRRCGQAPAPVIVLLHGIGSGAASWLATARQLAGVAQVIAWDAPGYGESSALSASQPRAEDYAARLLQMLDALQITRCVLVGHSLGAMTALCLARQHPERVSRLLLISPAQGYGAADRQVQREEVRSRRLASLEVKGVAGIAADRSAAMLSSAASPQQREWVRWNMARLNPTGYRQAIELLCGDDLLRHGQPAMPVSVLCGDADGITRPDACLHIAEALDASFALIAGAGHASPTEQPERVAGQLAAAIALSQGNLS